MRLVAPRRYGKTSVLLAHAARLRETGWRTAHVDFSRVADLTDVARRLAAAYAHLDSPWVRSHLSGLLARLGRVAVGARARRCRSGRARSPRTPSAAETVLPRLLDLPQALWEHDRTPTLVVFDEFQDLLVARKDLDGLLRSRIQYHGDAAAYVYAGSEPSMMRELFDTRERPLFGQADPLTLDPLPLDETLADLAARFAAEDLDPGEALAELVPFAAGPPAAHDAARLPARRPPRRRRDGHAGAGRRASRRRARAHRARPPGAVEPARAHRARRCSRRWPTASRRRAARWPPSTGSAAARSTPPPTGSPTRGT